MGYYIENVTVIDSDLNIPNSNVEGWITFIDENGKYYEAIIKNCLLEGKKPVFDAEYIECDEEWDEIAKIGKNRNLDSEIAGSVYNLVDELYSRIY